MASKPRRQLTDKEQLFVEHYFACNLNGTEAAAQAGYEGDRATLATTAWRLLRNAEVRRAINKRLKQVGMGADEVLARLASIARGDVDDLIDEFGNIDLKKARKLGKTYLIKKHKVTRRTFGEDGEVETVEIELHDPQAALVQLGRYHKLFTEKVDVTSDGKPLAAPIVYLPEVKEDEQP